MKRVPVSLSVLVLLFAAVSLIAPLPATAKERGIEVVGANGGQQVKGKKWAVIVGVNHYTSAITALKYCVADARGFYAKLIAPSGGFQAENIRLLVDDQPEENSKPTRANVIAALTDWLALAEENDLVLIYFSGHGVEKDGASYFLPGDALVNKPELTGVSIAFAQQQLQNCSAKRKVLILDTCHSGGKGGDPMGTATEKIFDQSSGMAILASCQVKESSYEWDAKGHGVFSYYLMEALGSAEADADRDGFLSVSEINRYVYLKVKQWAAANGVSQTPKRKEEVTGDILLARRPGNTVEKPEVEEVATVATLKLTGAPEGATVSVEGQQRGALPLDLGIDLGVETQKTIEVTVQKTGFQTKVYRIKAVRGKTIPLTIDLPKLPEPDKPQPPTPPKVEPPIQSKTKVNPKDGAEMVWIPSGEFTMGSTEQEIEALVQEDPQVKREWGDREIPQRRVNLEGYWIYKHEVTVAQYRKFCEETGHTMPTAPEWGWSDDHPIVKVNWKDAKAYSEWAGVELPSEAQWEKAARGTDGRKYPWGNQWDASRCASSADHKLSGTKPVGSYPEGVSPYGVHDMTGNVWQWCADVFAPYPGSPAKDETFKYKVPVLRGSAWSVSNTWYMRCASRGGSDADLGYSYIGFRCASR